MSEVFSNTPLWYTVVAEIASCLLYVSLSSKKKKEWWRYLLLVVLMGVHSGYFCLADLIYPQIGSFFMAGSFLLMYAYFCVCCECGWKKKLYDAIQALVLAEFLASAQWFLFLLFSGGRAVSQIVEIIFSLFIYAASILMLWLLEHKMADENPDAYITPVNLFSCVIIGFGTYIVSGLGIANTSMELQGEYGLTLFGLRAVIDFAGVAMLYAHNMQIYAIQVNQEKYAIQTILSNQKKVYEFSQECIDMVNLKYHDLKHQINRWKMEGENAEHEKYIEELSQKMELFDLKVNSGNQVIDTILTEKKFNCLSKNIQMITVIDGKELGFLEVEDLCALFGNAIDNAIEYEQGIKEEERRIIHITVRKEQEFVLVTFENYCETPQIFSHGLPRSTKANEMFHGYGLKSVRYVVHKYDGQFKISHEDNWFKLKIIFPIP